MYFNRKASKPVETHEQEYKKRKKNESGSQTLQEKGEIGKTENNKKGMKIEEVKMKRQREATTMEYENKIDKEKVGSLY